MGVVFYRKAFLNISSPPNGIDPPIPQYKPKAKAKKPIEGKIADKENKIKDMLETNYVKAEDRYVKTKMYGVKELKDEKIESILTNISECVKQIGKNCICNLMHVFNIGHCLFILKKPGSLLCIGDVLKDRFMYSKSYINKLIQFYKVGRIDRNVLYVNVAIRDLMNNIGIIRHLCESKMINWPK